MHKSQRRLNSTSTVLSRFLLPPDEFSDYWKVGFVNFGGGVGYSIIPAVSAVAYFDWNNFSFDGDKFAHDAGAGGMVSIEGGNASIMLISGNIKAQVPTGAVRPYFNGGAGLFLLSIDDVSVSGGGIVVDVEGDSENAFSINFGGGLDFTVAENVALFADGRYIIGFTEGESTSTFPIRVGVNFKL